MDYNLKNPNFVLNKVESLSRRLKFLVRKNILGPKINSYFVKSKL